MSGTIYFSHTLHYSAPNQVPQSPHNLCFGTCPSGTMTTRAGVGTCFGYLKIKYVIPATMQKSYHPHPDHMHSSIRRIAYLPDTTEGRQILFRFQYAFLHGLCFRVGRSLATGINDQVAWSLTLPHKSRTTGGPSLFGFPDHAYLAIASHALDQLNVPNDLQICRQWIIQDQGLSAGSMASSGNPLGHPAAGWTGMGAPFASTSHSVPDEIICYNAESSMGRMIDHYSQFLEPVINCCADEKECAICLDVMSPSSLTDTTNIVCLRKCKHRFHKSCIIGMLEQNHTKCPFCRETIAAESQGLSPSGKLTISLDLSIRCQGSEYDSDGVIVLQYSMPEGIQAHYMENPFMRYAGTSRRAYLPHNESGRALLKRLKYAFTHGLTFRVGTSLTTGKQNQITWASIHHKTSLRSGPHGYPDPQYLRNCNDSLDALHVPKGEDCP